MLGFDTLLLLLVALSLPIALMRPWIGVMVYTWLSTMSPQRLAGGFVYDMPLVRVVALATIVGLLFTTGRYALPRQREIVLLGLLWLIVTASTFVTALEPGMAMHRWQDFTKIMIMAGVALVLLQERRRLRLWLLVIALSLGFYGITGAIWGAQTGLTQRLFGPPDSQLTDNNALGFAFTMALPLLAFLRLDERAAWLRLLLLITFGATIVALFATYSRGAVVGFAIVLPLTALLIRTRDKGLLAVGAAACLVIYLAPEQWVERMQSITPTVYRDDSSGSERMKSWYVAWRLGVDHPLLGAGCHPFSPAVYSKYIPGYSDNHDAHNHFLQILAEHGFTGLLLFVALLVSIFLRLLRLAWFNRSDPERAWIVHMAQMLLVTLIAYVAGGVFINQPHSELLCQFIIAALVLDAIAAPAEPRVVGTSLLRSGWQRWR